MTTSSSYSSNKLQQILKNNTPHFILKSYITSRFEFDRRVPQYHIYWYNSKKQIFQDDPKYKCLSYKEMNKKERKYFRSVLGEYKEVSNSRDGIIWENKKLGFDKTLVIVSQLKLDI